MSDFSIWVEGKVKVPGKFPDTISHFDLDSYDAKSIYKTLKEEGITPCKGSVFHHNGFLDYKPKSIDEACGLYQEYQHLDDPKDWPLFLKWFQDPSIKVVKSVRNFAATFQGLYESPGLYLQRDRIEVGEISPDFDGMDFMDWDAYAESERDKGYLSFIIDPVSKKTGVFFSAPHNKTQPGCSP